MHIKNGKGTPVRKKTKYEKALTFVALNDEPEDDNLESITGYVSTILISETFGKECEEIAKEIIKIRKKENLI